MAVTIVWCNSEAARKRGTQAGTRNDGAISSLTECTRPSIRSWIREQASEENTRRCSSNELSPAHATTTAAATTGGAGAAGVAVTINVRTRANDDEHEDGEDVRRHHRRLLLLLLAQEPNERAGKLHSLQQASIQSPPAHPHAPS